MADDLDIAVIGGGAAGYFAALRAAELSPSARITIFEAGRRVLEKVKISGGGRCNVTHSCFDPAVLTKNYPRGGKELLGPFHKFQPKDTVAWFETRGVQLKTEEDGRIFPISDSSQTILDCLENARTKHNVKLSTGARIEGINLRVDKGYVLTLAKSAEIQTKYVILATGSSRSGHAFAEKLGHSITPLAPSLFTFTVPDTKLVALSGIAAADVQLKLKIGSDEICATQGPLLITHWGLSGPAVLKMSAWAARELHNAAYHAELLVDWTNGLNSEQIKEIFRSIISKAPRKLVINTPCFGLPSRLWEYIAESILVESSTLPWNKLSKAALQQLEQRIRAFELPVSGKGQFKEEFVTCGGVELSEVDFRTMESKKSPGLFFAGEILDIDGVTGGFNFQNAWTTGWIAGTSVASRL